MINGNSPPHLGAFSIPNLKLKSHASENLEIFSPPPSSHYSSCGEKLYHCDDSDCDNNKGMAIGYVTANSFETPTICGSFGSCNDYFLDSEVGSYRNMSFQDIRNLEQFDSPGYETEGSPLRSSRLRKKNSKNLHRKKNFFLPSENGIGVWVDKNNNNNTRVWSDPNEDGALSTTEGEIHVPDDRGESRIDGCKDLNTALELDGYRANRGNLSLTCQSQTSELNSIKNDVPDNFEFRTIECVEPRQLTSNSFDCSFGEDCRIADLDRKDVGEGQLNLRAGDSEVNGAIAGEGCSFTREFVSDHEGERNDACELSRLDDINHLSMSKRSSDFDSQSEFDSKMGDATDDEDDTFKPSQRDSSLNPRVDVKETGSDNPLLLNSEVVFGASDWDEFAEEVRGNDTGVSNQEVDVREVCCHVVSRSTHSKAVDVMEDIRGASNLKVEDFCSSFTGVAGKLVYEDMLTTPLHLGDIFTSSGSGRPDLEEDDRQEMSRSFDSVQTINRFRDPENLITKTNNHVCGDSGLSSELPNSLVDICLAEEEEERLQSGKSHIEASNLEADVEVSSLKASFIKLEDTNHEKELQCLPNKEEIQEEKNHSIFCAPSVRKASGEKGMSFLSSSDTNTICLPVAATEKMLEKVPRIEVNGESFIPMASRSSNIRLCNMNLGIESIDAGDWGKQDLGPDELSRYVEELDVNESYIDTVHDMEDVLLDSVGSVGGMVVHTNRSQLKQSSRGYKNEGLGTSTSDADSASEHMQSTLKLDWIEVVGAKQRTGGVSFGERLVGVKEYTIYRIRVHSGRNQWEIERRYRDFLGLYRQLKKTCGGQSRVNLPSPWELVERESRKVFGNASPDVISERSVLIQECLQSLLSAGSPFDSAPPLFWFLLPQKSLFDTTAALKGTASDDIKITLNEKESSCSSLHDLSLSSHSELSTSDYRDGNSEKFSTFGKTIRLIVQTHPHKSLKQLLEEQHYSCAGCYKHLDIAKGLMEEFVQTLGWGKPRLCEYTGQLLCTSCHLNETSVLPAQVLQHWDFTPRPVCQLSKAYLDSIYDQPMLCVSAVNPFIFSKLPLLVHVMEMRKKLSRMLACMRCPSQTTIQHSLRSRCYLLENSDFFALRDLVDLSKGAFAALPCLMEALSKKIYVHITHKCSICHEAGDLCGAQLKCEKPSSLIFPFQEGETMRCKSCGLLFHESCFRKLNGCQCTFMNNVNNTNGKSPLWEELDMESSLQSDLSSNPKTSSNLCTNKQGSTSTNGFLIDLFKKAIPDNILKPRKKTGVLNMASLSSSLGL
ncbi:uncharacterized protein LOC131067845 isoform X1 [Cryptomeria japonica]|uniref:uncharacterized protein LOC131067845 isoform X1 n=2 Tax=Cryptomeria japonica TaxID=3369 RepID=UPI0027DA173C|nr:uncharacterized protein LOC131067845 isoform X1 [Cryptomeria japonica]